VKVCFATPSLAGPHPAYLQAMKDTIPAIKAAGWDECYVQEIGCPYISHARATMTRKALDTDADVIVYLDSDMSWTPAAMLNFLSVDEPVVSGLYRFKKPEEVYMGVLKTKGDDTPVVRNHLILAEWVPGGFLKVTREAISRIGRAHPELLYGDPMRPHIDLFNHGAHNGVWYGEDYAFSRRWNAIGQIWIAPDLDIDHHGSDGTVYKGNFHQFMLRQPGGSEDPARLAA
jgi:hypothetical protein